MILRNLSYKYPALLSLIGSFLLQKPEDRIQRFADKLLFADRYSNAAKSGKIGAFISSFDEVSKKILRSLFHLWKFYQWYHKLSC